MFGLRAAPVIEGPYERGFEREYRRPGDPNYIVRINQKSPSGRPKKLASDVPVVGMKHQKNRSVVERFVLGQGRHVELRREPENQHDKNAIAVFGEWMESGQIRKEFLGYVPSTTAADIAKNHSGVPLGATVTTIFRPRLFKAPGLRIDVWGPRAKPARPKDRPYDPKIRVPQSPVDRNLKGQELEKEGLVDNAIQFYLANVEDGFDGSHPYDRLAVIFRRRGDPGREIAILEQAVCLFSQVSRERADRDPKLDRYISRLAKLKEKQDGE